jgi:hypothetical protein
MKKHFYILFLLVITIGNFFSCKNKSANTFQAPTDKEQGYLSLSSRACYFADADSIEKLTHIKIDTPSCREIEQIQSIMEYAGLPQNFKIYRGNIDNALATVVNNQRLIIYNKDLFSILDEVSSSYWTSLFIIAHEIGHHLANNISDTSNLLQSELDADKFASFILYKMGADSTQVTEAIASNLISANKDSKTHPAKNKRLQTVKQSWMEAFELRYLSAIPPKINDEFSKAANIPFVYNLVENHMNGFPPYYHPRGYNDYQLINNAFVLSLIDSTQAHNYSLFRTSDSSIYENFSTSVSRNYQGIIVDVKKRTAKPDYPEIVCLEIGILITKTDDKYNYARLLTNHRYAFLVCFEPGRYITQDIVTYYDFFAGGRHLEFDIFDVNKSAETFGLLNISRAYSL